MAKPRSKFKKVKWLFGKEVEIPEEWEIHTVESVSKKIVSGGTPSTTMLEYWNGNIPWTRSSVLLDPYLKSGEKFITAEGLRNSSSVLIPKNNLLVSSRVSVGNISISAIDVAISQDVTGIIINKAYARSEFLYWYLKQHIKKLVLISQGTTIQGFTRKELAKLLVFLPSLSEQQKIASVLSGVDAAIEVTQRMIEMTEMLKKGLMQKLLTRGIGHTKFKKVKMYFGKYEEIPEEWKIFNLGEKKILKLTSGKFISNIQEIAQLNVNYPIYGSNGIIGYTTSYNEDNAILIGRVGASGSVHYLDQKAWITDNVLIAKPNKILEKKFYYYALLHINLERFATKSAQPLLTQSILKTVKIKIPLLAEQQRIASILSGIDAYTQKNQICRKKLERLKKRLMQKLLTGQIRVKVES